MMRDRLPEEILAREFAIQVSRSNGMRGNMMVDWVESRWQEYLVEAERIVPILKSHEVNR